MKAGKLLIAAVAAAISAAGSAWAQSNVCQGPITDALSKYGITWTDLENVQWSVDKWNDSRRGGSTISGYQMYAEPKQCANGSIVAEMGDDCGVSDVYTRGDCKIKGLPNHWW